MEEWRVVCWEKPEHCLKILKKWCKSISAEDLEVALSKLGVLKGRPQARWKVARELESLALKAPRPTCKREREALLSKLVVFSRQSKMEFALLRVLRDLVTSKPQVFETLKEDLQAADTFYEGRIDQVAFFKCLERLDLNFNQFQLGLIARRFICGSSTKEKGNKEKKNKSKKSKASTESSGAVNYTHFLAILAPATPSETPSTASTSTTLSSSTSMTPSSLESSLTPGSSKFSSSLSSSSSESPCLSSCTSTTSGSFSTVTATLDLLERVRDRIEHAVTLGVDVRECFDFFDTDRDGIISSQEFINGLLKLGVKELSEYQIQVLLSAFRTQRKEGYVDYLQFMRFVDKDIDSHGFFTRNGIFSLEEDTSGATRESFTITEEEEQDPVFYHDSARDGPFVAGFTLTAKERARREKKKNEEPKEADGVFVRHSYTSAGYVKQKVVRHPKKTVIKAENHLVFPHMGKGGKERFTGVLEAQAKKPEECTLSKDDQRLMEISKKKMSVKYLGYYREFHKPEAPSRGVPKSRPVKPTKEEEGKHQEDEGEREEKEDVDFGAYAQKLQLRLYKLLFKARMEFFTRPRKNKFHPKLVDCQKEIVRCAERLLTDFGSENKTYPGVRAALMDRLKEGRPLGAVLVEYIKLIRFHGWDGNVQKAKEVGSFVETLLGDLEKSWRKRNKLSRRSVLRCTLAQEDEFNFSFTFLRNLFESLRTPNSDDAITLVSVAELYRLLRDQCCLLSISPLNNLRSILASQNDAQDKFAQWLFEGSSRTERDSVSWQELMHALRRETGYMEFIQQGLQEWFAEHEFSTLRSIFVSSRLDECAVCKTGQGETHGVVFLACRCGLTRRCQEDSVIWDVIANKEAFLQSLQARMIYSWEEFVTLVRDNIEDFSFRELRTLLFEALGEAYVRAACPQLSQSPEEESKRVNRAFAKLAAQYVTTAFQDRLDIVNHQELHPSLVGILGVVSTLREVQAKVEEEDACKLLDDSIDRYLCSRSGKYALEKIVRQVMDQNESKSGIESKERKQVCRERAEMAAIQTIRQRKKVELSTGERFSLVSSLKREMMQYSRACLSICEKVWGHTSLEASEAHFQLALRHERRTKTRDAANALTAVLHNLTHMEGREHSAEIGSVASFLGKLFEKLGCFKDAATKYELSAECLLETDKGDKAIQMLRQSMTCLRKLSSEYASQERVLALLVKIEERESETNVDLLVEDKKELGEVYLKLGNLVKAKENFRGAKELVLRRDVLRPAHKRLVCRLNRLLASAAASSELVGLVYESNEAGGERDKEEEEEEEEEDDLANASWLQ